MVNPSSFARKCSGFSLLESMVVVLLTGLLLLVGMPLARGWMVDATTRQAESQLRQAYGKARAMSLRNPLAVSGGMAAASLRIAQSDVVEVLPGASGSISWSAHAGRGAQWLLTDSAANTAVACGNVLSFNNNGLPLGHCRFFRITLPDGDIHVVALD